MNSTLIKPILLGLDDEFSDEVYLLFYEPNGKYVAYYTNGVHGIACFNYEDKAQYFSEYLGTEGLKIQSMSFDEARDLAKSKNQQITALILLDDINNPKIHYVK